MQRTTELPVPYFGYDSSTVQSKTLKNDQDLVANTNSCER